MLNGMQNGMVPTCDWTCDWTMLLTYDWTVAMILSDAEWYATHLWMNGTINGTPDANGILLYSYDRTVPIMVPDAELQYGMLPTWLMTVQY